jgi:hypothetical protein
MVTHNHRQEIAKAEKKKQVVDGDILPLTLRYPWWRMVGAYVQNEKPGHQH